MKLRIILTVLTISAFVCVIVGGNFYYQSLKQSVQLECEKHNVRHAENARARFLAFLSENRRSIKALAGLQPLATAAADPSADNIATINSTLDHFANALRAEACYLINRQGIVIASSNRNQPDSFVGIDLGFRPYFQNAVNGTADIYMALGTASGRRGIYYSHPVYEPGQPQPIAVAVIKSSPDTVEAEWQAQTASKDNITVVTDANGIIFVTSHKEWLLHLLWPLDETQSGKLAATDQFGPGPWEPTRLVLTKTNRAQDQNGTEYLMHEIALQNFPGWRIIQFSNFQSVYERISGPLTQIAGWSTMAVCLLIGGLFYGLYYKADTEICRRQKAEADLRSEHEILDTVLSASPIGICLLENRHIRWANHGFRNLFGLKRRMDYEGHSELVFYPTKEEFDRVGQAIYTRVSQGEVAETDAQLKRQNGSVFTGHVTARSTNLQQPMQQIICTISDISERLRAEEERVSKEKLQGVLEIAGAICHEQNQPLMAVTGYCSLALMEIEPDHPVCSKINSIEKAAERMAAINAKLMNITRYQTCEYADGIQIIDIDQSTAPPDN